MAAKRARGCAKVRSRRRSAPRWCRVSVAPCGIRMRTLSLLSEHRIPSKVVADAACLSGGVTARPGRGSADGAGRAQRPARHSRRGFRHVLARRALTRRAPCGAAAGLLPR